MFSFRSSHLELALKCIEFAIPVIAVDTVSVETLASCVRFDVIAIP